MVFQSAVVMSIIRDQYPIVCISYQEDGDDDAGHDGDPEGVSPLHLLSLIIAALTRVESSVGVSECWSVGVSECWSVRVFPLTFLSSELWRQQGCSSSSLPERPRPGGDR